MAKKSRNCTQCGRGNCLAKRQPECKALRLNELIPIVTKNTLGALAAIENHNLNDLKEHEDVQTIFLDRVRKACDAVGEMNRIDCRLLREIFGTDLKARYYGKGAGAVRDSLSHVLMQDPDLEAMYEGVITHFPVWYETFAEMTCEPVSVRSKQERERYYSKQYNRRLISLEKLSERFMSNSSSGEDGVSFIKGGQDSKSPPLLNKHDFNRMQVLIDRFTSWPTDLSNGLRWSRFERGGLRYVGFEKDGAPKLNRLVTWLPDETKLCWLDATIYRRWVNHNPLWAWMQEMDGMYGCEYGTDSLHPKELCSWQDWHKPRSEVDVSRIVAERAYIEEYERVIADYKEVNDPDESSYDVIVIHQSPVSPAPFVVYPLPAEARVTPKERFEILSNYDLKVMAIRSGLDPKSILGMHVHASLTKGKLLKRESFVAHVTPKGSLYSWPTDGSSELLWQQD